MNLVFKLFATSLLLALVLVCVFFVSGSPQAHAAQLKPAVEKSSTLPMSEQQTDSAHTAMNNCKPAGTVYTYWWGLHIHLTSCGVQLVESGAAIASVFPDTTIPGGVAVAVLSGASALSCDGSVNLDYPWVNEPFAIPPTVKPGC